MKKMQGLLVFAVVIGMMVPVQALDKKAAPAPAAGADKMAQMMALWQKNASPGENHKVLDAFAGDWENVMRNWMSPGQPPQESKGTNSNQWVYGGRFLKQEYKGPMMGMMFEGVGFTGYDNMKGEYVSVWLDNMSTGMMVSSPKYDAASKSLNEDGTMSCPGTGEKAMWYRSVWKSIDADHYSLEMYNKSPDGKEFKAMEIQCVRVKPAISK